MADAQPVLVWGGGGHGKVVADLARCCGYDVAGFIDSDRSKLGRPVDAAGALVVLGQEDFLALLRDGGELPRSARTVACAVGNNAIRLKHVQLLGSRAAAALIHPKAAVSASAVVGPGAVMLALAVVNAEAVIGPAAIINSGAIIEHDCVIGPGAHVSPGAVIAGGATVGARSWIGAGAVVIHGVHVGADVVVGAGAVVLRDVPDGMRMAGVPAVPIRGAEARC